MEEKGIDFEGTLPWKEDRSESLVIHCSDHRYQSHFDEFIEKGLKLKSPTRLALPGGPQPLIGADYLPKFEWAGRRWVKFIVKLSDISQIICLAHLDCAWYQNITVGNLTVLQLKDRQISDLRKVREALQEMAPKIQVRMFFAQPNSRGRVEFMEIH